MSNVCSLDDDETASNGTTYPTSDMFMANNPNPSKNIFNINNNADDIIIEEQQNGVDTSGTPIFTAVDTIYPDDMMNDADEELAQLYMLKTNYMRRHTIGLLVLFSFVGVCFAIIWQNFCKKSSLVPSEYSGLKMIQISKK